MTEAAPTPTWWDLIIVGSGPAGSAAECDAAGRAG